MTDPTIPGMHIWKESYDRLYKQPCHRKEEAVTLRHYILECKVHNWIGAWGHAHTHWLTLIDKIESSIKYSVIQDSLSILFSFETYNTTYLH